jgi:hypothetical protein
MLRFVVASSVVLSCFAFTIVQQNWTSCKIDEVDAAHKKSDEFYAALKTYTMKLTYSSFKGHESILPYESSEGYYRYDNGRSHTYVQGIHTYVGDKYKLIVDSARKTMVVTDKPTELSSELMQINYTNSKLYMTGTSKQVTNVATVYKMDFNDQVTYSSYSLSFATSGQLSDITVFYRKEYPSDPKSPGAPKLKPKLKVAFGVPNEKVTFNANTEFNLTRFFTESKGNLKATAAYSSYQLIDSRTSRKR